MPSRRNAAVSEKTKQRLIDESVRLIRERGLAGLSFREMSRRAGVSHQTPYHHFVNREGILAAIVQQSFEMLDRRLVEARAKNRHRHASQVLRHVLRAYMTFAVGNPVHYGLMFRPELVDLSRYPETRATALTAFGRLVETVRECHPEAPSNDRRVNEIANALWAAAHGVATLWLDGPLGLNLPRFSIAAFVDMTAQMFSNAGAVAPFDQNSSDRFSDARTTSSRTT